MASSSKLQERFAVLKGRFLASCTRLGEMLPFDDLLYSGGAVPSVEIPEPFTAVKARLESAGDKFDAETLAQAVDDVEAFAQILTNADRPLAEAEAPRARLAEIAKAAVQHAQSPSPVFDAGGAAAAEAPQVLAAGGSGGVFGRLRTFLYCLGPTLPFCDFISRSVVIVTSLMPPSAQLFILFILGLGALFQCLCPFKTPYRDKESLTLRVKLKPMDLGPTLSCHPTFPFPSSTHFHMHKGLMSILLFTFVLGHQCYSLSSSMVPITNSWISIPPEEFKALYKPAATKSRLNLNHATIRGVKVLEFSA